MIPKKKRTARSSLARSALRSYKQTAPLNIGQTREQRKSVADELEAAIIKHTREIVFKLHATCQICGGKRRGECMGLDDQMHEDPSRAQTRGQPPWKRFNVLVCGRVCAACHRDLTEYQLEVEFLDEERRWMGPIGVVE